MLLCWHAQRGLGRHEYAENKTEPTHHVVIDRVHRRIRDGVVARDVVTHVGGAQQTGLLEGPLGEGHTEVLVAGLLKPIGVCRSHAKM